MDIAETELMSRYGAFKIYVWNGKPGKEPVVLTTLQLNPSLPVLVRIHSECLTGDSFGSQQCDCGQQKDASLSLIANSENGIFVYHRAEGRGIGLFHKIKAYYLQRKFDLDTYDANVQLGFRPDERRYDTLRDIFDKFGIKEVKLITNNLEKIQEIEKLGVRVVERVPLIVPSNHYNKRYLETKRVRFGHLLAHEQT